MDNLYAINLIDDETLEECVGPFWKSELRRMSGGGEPLFLTRIDRNSHMKSIGRSITGWGLTGSEDQIKRTLYNLTSEVCTKARKMSLVGRQMSIRLYGENKKFKNHVTLKNFTNHTNEVFEVIYHQLYKPHKRGFRVIKLGVRLGLLQPDNKLTIPLLPPWQRFENLYRAVDKINGKYTQHTIHSAAMHAPKMITEEITGFLGDKIYQFEYK